jgi:hypothetical protein
MASRTGAAERRGAVRGDAVRAAGVEQAGPGLPRAHEPTQSAVAVAAAVAVPVVAAYPASPGVAVAAPVGARGVGVVAAAAAGPPLPPLPPPPPPLAAARAPASRTGVDGRASAVLATATAMMAPLGARGVSAAAGAAAVPPIPPSPPPPPPPPPAAPRAAPRPAELRAEHAPGWETRRVPATRDRRAFSQVVHLEQSTIKKAYFVACRLASEDKQYRAMAATHSVMAFLLGCFDLSQALDLVLAVAMAVSYALGLRLSDICMLKVRDLRLAESTTRADIGVSLSSSKGDGFGEGFTRMLQHCHGCLTRISSRALH